MNDSTLPTTMAADNAPHAATSRPSSASTASTASTANAANAAAARRTHRAAVALALSTRAPREAAAVDWDVLGQAPAWLALDEGTSRMLRRRVGSVLLAPALRLWISASRVQAARAALGEDWWARLLRHDAWPSWSSRQGEWPSGASSSPDGVAGVLEEAGSAVLLGTLPHGALRSAAAAALAPVADLALSPPQAQAVLDITLRMLEAEAASGIASASDNEVADTVDEHTTAPRRAAA